MAFNPFRAFRKHQRAMFAGLTIICMLTFVMASGISGAGDFFSEMQRLIVGGGKYPEVARLYGSRVDLQQIRLLRNQRVLADQYIRRAVMLADQMIVSEIQKDKDYDESAKRFLNEMLMARMMAQFGPQFDQGRYMQNLAQYLRQLQLVEETLQTQKKTAQAEDIRRLQSVMLMDSWLMQPKNDSLYADSNLFFGGSLSPQGLLDFMVWKHEADRLGIYLAPDDLVEELSRATFGRMSKENGQMFERQMRLPIRWTPESVQAALTDEFRVRLAQSTLVGYNPGGATHVPAQFAPYEFFEFYRKQRTEVSVKLLPVPAEKFLPEVKEQPTDDELRALYDKYKDDVPQGSSDTPGFKLPRRVKVEWIEANPETDRYRKAAQVALDVTQATLPLAWNVELYEEYDRQKFSKAHVEGFSWNEYRFPPPFSYYLYNSPERRLDAATAVGLLLGSAATRATPIPAFMGYVGTAVERENRALATLGARSVLWGAAGRTAPFQSILPLIQFTEARAERTLPLDSLKDQLTADLKDKYAEHLVSQGIDAFRKDLQTRRGRPAEAAKFASERAAQQGWKHGMSTELRDVFTIAADPGLQPLREGFTRRNTSPMAEDPKARQFAMDLIPSGKADPTKLFEPRELAPQGILDAKSTILYWKTADEAARQLPFEEVRSKVLAAWKLDKARQLARAEAERLVKSAAETKGAPLPVLRDAEKRFGAMIDLPNVARWIKSPTPRADLTSNYAPFQIREDKIEYADRNMVDDLVDNLKEVGDALLLSNAPKDIYYVAVLTRREVPAVKEFLKDTNSGQGFFLSAFEYDRRLKYRQSVLEDLRAQAGLTINDAGLKDAAETGNFREDE